jgi:cyclase
MLPEVRYAPMRTVKTSAVSTILFLLLFSCGAKGQTSPPQASGLAFTLKPLGHDVYAAISASRDAGSNAGLVIGDDGVVVIDTFTTEKGAKQLLDEIRKLTKLPIKFVVNTHYHLDHVGGNGVFQDAGATVIAHKNVAGWIHTENLKFFGKDIKPEMKAVVEGIAAPEVLYDSALELRLGSHKVLVSFAPGHTGGDSLVLIPDANVLFCGDLFWRRTLPNLIDATTSDWANTLKGLSVLAGGGGRYVPGHGDVGTAADVDEFRGYLLDLRSMTKAAADKGLNDDALVNDVMPPLQEKYGKWNFFDHFAKRNILDMAAELRGTKKIPTPAAKD